MTKHRRHVWTEQQERTLRLFYADTRTDTIAQILDISLVRVYQKAGRLGLRKSPEYMASPDACRLRRDNHPGVAFQFRKGHVPANKGLRGRPSTGRMAETQFKPGMRPHTWMPIGSERYSKEGYLCVKLTDTGYPPRDWVPVHLLLWQLHRGAVPAGHAVCFKDGDKRHIAIDNLECITRGALMLRNTVHNLPKPLAELVLLRGALKRKINRRLKTHERRTEE